MKIALIVAGVIVGLMVIGAIGVIVTSKGFDDWTDFY